MSEGKWVPVEERLPEENAGSYILTDGHTWFRGYFSEDRGKFYMPEYLFEHEDVTHWRKPPTLPKETKKSEEKQHLQ